jgi:hypothetical protein
MSAPREADIASEASRLGQVTHPYTEPLRSTSMETPPPLVGQGPRDLHALIVLPGLTERHETVRRPHANSHYEHPLVVPQLAQT